MNHFDVYPISNHVQASQVCGIRATNEEFRLAHPFIYKKPNLSGIRTSWSWGFLSTQRPWIRSNMNENQRKCIIWKYKSNETYIYMGIYQCLQNLYTPVMANIRTQHHWNSVRKMMTIIIYQTIISRQSPVIRSTCHNTLQWHAWVTRRHSFHHPTTFLPFKRKWGSDTGPEKALYWFLQLFPTRNTFPCSKSNDAIGKECSLSESIVSFCCDFLQEYARSIVS